MVAWKNMRKTESGFTLIELMVVVAILAFLSMLVVPSLMKFLAKAKRAEAYVNLSSLAMAQKAYFADNGTYTMNLTGDLGWKPGGNSNYSYGFAQGALGKSHFIGKLKTSAGHLTGSKLTPEGFTIVAAGHIYNKDKPDILSVDQDNTITILQDGLA
jgi:prepilin-type N-terminal cleavage/methylation domain-containing protein